MKPQNPEATSDQAAVRRVIAGHSRAVAPVVSAFATSITSLVEALSSIAKLALIATVLIVAWENRPFVGTYISKWLESTTHLSFLGLSLDRQAAAEQKITEIASRPTSPYFNATYARGAIIHASRNAPAISGARLLWVDGHPQNNDLEAGIFADMGVEVHRATNTDEVLQSIPSFAPDLIISNLNRENDRREPLHNCQAHYYEMPPGLPGTLDQLNFAVLAGTSAMNGFSMAELISRAFPFYTRRERPQIIFYTSVSGGFAASRCARIVTNQVDVLLQSVVSALEELRWQKLDVDMPSTPAKTVGAAPGVSRN